MNTTKVPWMQWEARLLDLFPLTAFFLIWLGAAGSDDGGRILLIESTVQPSNGTDTSASRDLMMLILSTERERTEHEFQQLLAEAGLRLTWVPPLGDSWIIETIPV
jgi:hypothetical protein